MSAALLDLACSAARAFPAVTGAPVVHMIRENAVFRVETVFGPHALRLHRPGYHSDAALNAELSWMGMLAEQGLKVPRPLPTAPGGYLLPGPRRASLLSWLAGRPMGRAGVPLDLGLPARRQAVFAAIGRALARLHLCSDRWQAPADFTRPDWTRAGLLGEAPFWGRFWAAPGLSPADRQLFAAARNRAQAILAARAADCGMIHADLVRENILLEGDEVNFIDFDDCGFGYRGFDLATCLRANRTEPDYPALKAALLARYAALRPLPDPDLLPLMLALRGLTYVGWAAARIDEPGMAEQMPRHLALARRLVLEWQAA